MLVHGWRRLQARAALPAMSAAQQAARRQSGAADGGTPAEQFLASLVNWEQRGVPAGAGAAAAGSSGSSGAPSGSSGSGAAFDLQRMQVLLRHLGSPQAAYPVVHVAGTKGKGSVTAMLAAMLRAAGYRVGAYTSPHLLHLTERIQCPAASAAAQGAGGSPGSCGGAPISREAFEQLVQGNRGALDAAEQELAAAMGGSAGGGEPEPGSARLTHFEVVTALALRHFADTQADIAVVEVGMGGAADATNVFDGQQLQAAVVTPIGLDHVAALGGSLASIAAAKAGILRAGRPLVLAAQPLPEARDVVLAEADRLGCEPVVHAADCAQVAPAGPVQLDASSGPHCARQAVAVAAQAPDAALSLPAVSMQLVGDHQRANTATAVTAALQLRQQGWRLPDDAIVRGLADAYLPGRFQVTRPDPAGPWYLLDGAHTADSAAALAEAAAAAFPPGTPIALVLAMAADKEHRGTVTALRGLAPRVVVFTSVAIGGSYQRSAPPGTLAANWQAAAFLDRGKPFRCRELIQASLQAALEKARLELRHQPGEGPGVVCVAGSLHAVAGALKNLGLA